MASICLGLNVLTWFFMYTTLEVSLIPASCRVNHFTCLYNTSASLPELPLYGHRGTYGGRSLHNVVHMGADYSLIRFAVDTTESQCEHHIFQSIIEIQHFALWIKSWLESHVYHQMSQMLWCLSVISDVYFSYSKLYLHMLMFIILLTWVDA